MSKRRKAARVPTGRPRPVQAPKQRSAKAKRPRVLSGPDEAGPGESGSRFAPVRRRAGQAKIVLGAVAVLVFGSGIALARASYAGHSKHHLRPLAAPPAFVKIVRQNLLEAGIVAPAQAPPGAGTSVS